VVAVTAVIAVIAAIVASIAAIANAVTTVALVANALSCSRRRTFSIPGLNHTSRALSSLVDGQDYLHVTLQLM
jgi:glycerol-3-phosphate O-acyltransferase